MNNNSSRFYVAKIVNSDLLGIHFGSFVGMKINSDTSFGESVTDNLSLIEILKPEIKIENLPRYFGNGMETMSFSLNNSQ